MKGGKPTRRGLGSPSDTSDSEPPASSRLSRQTHRGLGDSQPPKLVTMHGVAPPSDPPPPPVAARQSSSAPAEGDIDLRHSAVPRFQDHELPPDVLAELKSSLEERTDTGEASGRAQFRTAPGGGKNRVSGGRSSAAAYVSPSTLAPGHGAEPRLGPVEVDEHVLREARSFQTEPSLMRKRASQVPPEAQLPVIPKTSASAWPWLIAGAVVASLLLVYFFASPGPTAPFSSESAPGLVPTGGDLSAAQRLEMQKPQIQGPEQHAARPEVAADSEPASAASAPTVPSTPSAPEPVEPEKKLSGTVAAPKNADFSSEKNSNENAHGPNIGHAEQRPKTPSPSGQPAPERKQPTAKHERDLWLE